MFSDHSGSTSVADKLSPGYVNNYVIPSFFLCNLIFVLNSKHFNNSLYFKLDVKWKSRMENN